MKKGLSILLVAAALFGFYGGAVSINDVLACKGYWEEEGEKTTADLNKLEDGLNQLKDNEQAYLDGKDQLADAEVALADGEAQYAKGLADYAAAPAKLANGESQLAEGKKSYSDLQTLIKGLKKARKHGVSSTKEHDEYWHDAFSEALKPGRQLIVSTFASEETAQQIAMIGGLVGDPDLAKDINSKSSYPAFDKNLLKLVKAFGSVSKQLKGFADLATGYSKNEDLDTAYTLLTDEDAAKAKLVSAVAASIQGMSADQIEPLLKLGAAGPIKYALTQNGMPEAQAQILADALANPAYDYNHGCTSVITPVRAGVSSNMKDAMKELGDNLALVEQLSPELAAGINDSMLTLIANTCNPDQFAYSIKAFQGYLGKLGEVLNGLASTLDSYADSFKEWDAGYQKLSHSKDGEVSKEYSEDLADTSSGIPYAFKNMLSNSTIKSAVKKYDKSLLRVLKKYSGNRLTNDSMEEFDSDIVYLSEKIIPRALKVLARVKSDANKQLAAGKAELAAGYADYKAAPGKLADAEQQLADGRKQLEDGKAQLAEYEDGEQQVRDGLATLVGTEPDLALEGILDRLDGDGDFDNGDEHLEIAEGLEGVEAGRAYQADDGELVTEEIMARAVGTGALLGAGVLAVLAAILSFLKKNKGAGIFAILAAAAGGFGAVYGTNAGTYFSDIAGSNVGTTAWIAAGILGAVALVHAIVHLTAKKVA